MPISIHGKQYVTVAERVLEAGKDFLSLDTEVLFQNPVVVKATVTTTKGNFSGISGANPNKQIEKMSPYEVAETSAVGRALGFAGYGAVEGIATADEVVKAEIIDTPYNGDEASMYDLDSTIKIMKKLVEITDDVKRKEAGSEVIKGLELAKKGEKKLTKAEVMKIKNQAIIRTNEIQGEVI